MGEMASCSDHVVLALPIQGKERGLEGRKLLPTHMKISLQSDGKRFLIMSSEHRFSLQLLQIWSTSKLPTSKFGLVPINYSWEPRLYKKHLGFIFLFKENVDPIKLTSEWDSWIVQLLSGSTCICNSHLCSIHLNPLMSANKQFSIIIQMLF